MSDASNSQPAAGWYDDTTSPGRQRYWDGVQWTDQTRLAQATGAPAPAPVDTKKRPHVVGWVAFALALVGFIFACVPGALIIGWVLLPIAFILAIVAFFLAGAKWPAITALVLSVVGTIVGVVVFMTVVATSFDEAFKEAGLTERSVAPEGAEEPASEDPAAEEPELGNLAFGETASFEDGVTISVAAPVPYTPSEYAAGASFPTNVAIAVTITNGSEKNFEPLSNSTLTSGGQAGSQIFDSSNDITMPPSGVILPGQSITWTEAWSVADVNAIVFQTTPSMFEYDEVVFTNVK